MATEATTVQDVEAKRKEAELAAAQKKVDEANSARTGIGTRLKVGATRGRNTMVITYENFDESKPDTLPKSIEQFMEITKVNEQSKLVEYLIAGYNDEQYTAASDPIAEFIDPTWDSDKQTQFRLVVRNFSKMLGVSIEDAANKVLANMK